MWSPVAIPCSPSWTSTLTLWLPNSSCILPIFRHPRTQCKLKQAKRIIQGKFNSLCPLITWLTSVALVHQNLDKWTQKTDCADAYFIAWVRDPYVSIFLFSNFTCPSVLDPNYKFEYARSQWNADAFDEGVGKFGAVVSSDHAVCIVICC
jgi:hypothetical protein